jgi:RNA-directed DNA polymerase
VTKDSKEQRPEAVPDRAIRVGEARSRWDWVEPSVWTPRMLEALKKGVQGGKWYSLIDKVYSPENLAAAWKQVRRNRGAPGVDHVTIEQFERRLDENLGRLASSLRSESYVPSPVRRVLIPKAGRPGETRPLGIPTVRDRVTQAAVRNVLEPIFEVGFSEMSFGFRPRRGAKDALRQVRQGIEEGRVHVVDADLKSYFDTIPHARLMEQVGKKVKDRRILALLESWLHQQVMDDVGEWTPEQGSPQGAVISPLLANIYLDELDHLVANAGFKMVRYADDFVILCLTREDAEAALALVKDWTAAAGLTLHPSKTRLVDLTAKETFDFLGYAFSLENRWPSAKSNQKIRDRIREMTPRNRGRSLRSTIDALNRVLRGWYQYFRHAQRARLNRVDGWVRQRLRAILWKFQKGRGFPPPSLFKKYNNAYFAAQGLFSLAAKHAEETAQLRLPLQPARR